MIRLMGQSPYLGPGTGPLKTPLFQTLVLEQPSLPFPDQAFDPVGPSSAEKIQGIRNKRAAVQAVLDQRSKTVHS